MKGAGPSTAIAASDYFCGPVDDDEFIPTEPELIEQLKPGPTKTETPEEYAQRVWEAIEAAAKA